MNMLRIFFVITSFVFLPMGMVSAAPIVLQDADGQTLTLANPAKRVVSLAPHLTEMLMSVGADSAIVGAADDHEARGAHAKSLTGFSVVSDAVSINYEKIRALKPDVILAWGEGTPKAWIAQLRYWGLPVFVVGTKKLEDLATQVMYLGKITGHEGQAGQQAALIQQNIRTLAGYEAAEKPRLRYFLQVWRQPLYSLHQGHLLSKALARCGADNVLPLNKIPAPLVNPEFVLRSDPDVMLIPAEDAVESKAYWSRFADFRVARQERWVVMDDPRLTRPGPGMISAAIPLCQSLQKWR